jgi:hypothetical protein
MAENIAQRGRRGDQPDWLDLSRAGSCDAICRFDEGALHFAVQHITLDSLAEQGRADACAAANKRASKLLKPQAPER